MATWQQIGNGLPISVSTFADRLAALSSTRIAAHGGSTDRLATYDWDGTDWSQVGNSLSLSAGGHNLDIAALSSSRVALITGSGAGTLRTYDFDGTNWSQTGNTLSLFNYSFYSVAALNSTDVAVWGNGDFGESDAMRTYRFDGTDWSQVGNSFNTTEQTVTIKTLTSTDVLFIGEGSSQAYLRTYTFDGSDWSQVGNSLVIGLSATFPGASLGSAFAVVYFNIIGDGIKTYSWDGADWSVDGPTSITGILGDVGITALDATTIAVHSSSKDELRTYRYKEKPHIMQY